VERGERLPTDPWLAVVAQPSPKVAAVVSFPGYVVVAADVDPAWVAERLPDHDLSAPLNPPFLAALERRLGRRVNNIDMVLLADAEPGEPELTLRAVDDADHPRVRRARRYRDHVRVWITPAGGEERACERDHPGRAGPAGVLVLGRGLAGRWEAAIEVDETQRNAGLGRRLAAAARRLVGPGPVWAQVAPGNAASVRAFLAAGYRPVGAEALLVP
jgi:hypothetical protein